MLPVSNLLDGNLLDGNLLVGKLLVGKLLVSKLLAGSLWGLGWRARRPGPAGILGADAPAAGR
jgi:hypothetical protein